MLLKRGMAGLGPIAGWHDLANASGGIFLLGAGLYVVSFILWLRVLSRWPLSVAYPMAISLTLAFSLLLGVLCLGERLSAHRLSGVALIIGGAVMLTRDL